MPPDLPSPGSAEDWLRHARSDLALSRAPLPQGVLLEDLCFHAQQAAEKAYKAVLVSRGIEPGTHSIRQLQEALPPGIHIPADVEHAVILTDYAVSSRYAGRHETVDQIE